jgi:hypothetical protein
MTKRSNKVAKRSNKVAKRSKRHEHVVVNWIASQNI